MTFNPETDKQVVEAKQKSELNAPQNQRIAQFYTVLHDDTGIDYGLSQTNLRAQYFSKAPLYDTLQREHIKEFESNNKTKKERSMSQPNLSPSRQPIGSFDMSDLMLASNKATQLRLKKHVSLFKKLRNIVYKHADNALFYIRTFISRVLEVPTLDIPEADVLKFVDYLKSGSLPHPDMSVQQIIMHAILGDEADLNEFLPKIDKKPKYQSEVGDKHNKIMFPRSSSAATILPLYDKSISNHKNSLHPELHEWKDKLGEYKRIRVKKAKFLRSMKAKSVNKEKVKALNEQRKHKKEIIQNMMAHFHSKSDKMTLEKIILKRTNRKLRKKYKGRILKTTKPEPRQSMIENDEELVKNDQLHTEINE